MRSFVVSTLFFISLCLPGTSFAASLSVSPSVGTYSVGDQIRLNVLVSSADASINAVSAALSVTPSIFSIQSVSKGNSVLNFWVSDPTFSNSTGIVEFEGVSLSGFQGSGGNIITVTLRALKVGVGTVGFKSGQVLANDGQGTDITSGLSGATFQIEAAKAKPSAPPTPVVQEEKVQPEVHMVSVLSAPVIILEQKDSAPAISGSSAYPNASVLLTYVPVAGSKLFITDVTSADGSFILPVPRALRNGSYAVSAVVVKQDGTQTVASNVLEVEVGGTFVADVSWENATYASLFLIILLATFAGYVLSREHFRPKKYVPSTSKRDIKGAEDALHKSFSLLAQDLSRHLKHVSTDGKGNSEERQEIADIKKDLIDAENYIDKQIKNINEKE